MKKAVIALLTTVLLAGCSGKTNTDNIEKKPDPLMEKGSQAILEIVPKEYMVDMPLEEIENVSAEIKGSRCTLWVTWKTDMPLEEGVSMVSRKLGYELKLDDDKWKGNAPEGTALPNVVVYTADDLKGLIICYMIDVDHAAENIALLTENFPAAYFDILPDSLKFENASKGVRSSADNRVYSMSWTYELSEGQKIADKLFTMYIKKDNYSRDKKDNGEGLSFNVNQKDTMSIEHRIDGNSSIIHAAYTYKVPSHLESPLMKALINDPAGSLLGDLRQKYEKIMGDKPQGIILSYIPEEKTAGYEMMVSETGNLEEIVEKASQVLKGEFELDNKGQYRFIDDAGNWTIKPGSGKVAFGLEEEVADNFTHAYIHDIYPAEYEPELPDVLSETPFIMETEYSNNNGSHIVFRNTWRFKEESGAKDVWKQLDDNLKSFHNYSAGTGNGREFINCFIKQYSFECNLEKKGDFWIISTAFRHGIKQ